MTLALCLLFGATLSAAAEASPADLRSVIAPPPANDYVEATPKPDQLDGAFDAKGYADFISAVNNDDASSLEGYLIRYGFTRGYGVTWIERGSRYYLEVFVLEFKLPTGAQLWLGDEKDGTSTMDEYRGELAGGTTIPGAWTGRVSTGSFGAYRVGFVKGNDYYVLSLDSNTADLSSTILKQAQAQYDFAPKSTLPPGVVAPSVAAANSSRNTMTAVAWVVGGIITIVLIGTVVIVLLLLFRRPRPAAVPVQTQYSDIPLDATRSPDGAYWWDGVTWRPVVPPRSPY